MNIGGMDIGWEDVATGGGTQIYKQGKKLFSGPSAESYDPNRENFNYNTNQYFQGAAENAAGRQNPQANMSLYAQSRGQAQDARNTYAAHLQDLRNARDNPENSVAAQQLRAGQDANMRQALALARSGQGGAAGSASAMRAAQFQNAQAAQQGNQAAAALRAQEVTAANSQLTQAHQAQRAMDLQAQGLDAQTALNQAQLELQGRSANDQYALGLYGAGHAASMGQLQGSMGYENLKGKQILGASTANAQFDSERDAAAIGTIGTLTTGAATGKVKSDTRSKERISDLEDENKMLRNIAKAFGGREPGRGTWQPSTDGPMSDLDLDRAAKYRQLMQREYRGPAPEPILGERGFSGVFRDESYRQRPEPKSWGGPITERDDFVNPVLRIREGEPINRPEDFVDAGYVQRSDTRSKQEIKELRDENSLLRNVANAFGGASIGGAAQVRPIAFSYKPAHQGEYGPQRRESGVDAASLERAPGYRHTVQRGADGMREVKTGDLALANTAHIAALAKKVEEDEAAKHMGAPAEPRSPHRSGRWPQFGAGF